MHFDEEMGFQFLCPRSTVLSPPDPSPPTVRDTIVVLAGGRHCCIGLGGVGFVPSNEDLAFRDSVCHLMNLFLRTMFKLRQGPVQFLGLFLATEQEEFFLKRPRIWNHFGSFFLGRELYQVTTFFHLLDYLAAQAGPEKMHFVAECR